MPLNYLKELLQLSLLLKATADSLQYKDVNVLFPNIPLSLLGGRDIHLRGLPFFHFFRALSIIIHLFLSEFPFLDICFLA